MNPLNFAAVILRVLLVYLLAALNFANVFFKNKKRLENKKRKNVFYIYDFARLTGVPDKTDTQTDRPRYIRHDSRHL